LGLEARSAQITIEPVTEAQARITRQADRDFGKMSGHPAKLNFGDCFSYALAKPKESRYQSNKDVRLSKGDLMCRHIRRLSFA
jgi:uncharacterized protein with PIN domain